MMNLMYLEGANMNNAFTGWKTICGYDCYLEDGYIVRLLDMNHELRFLWKPSGNGLDAIPRCSVSRFRNGLKTGNVVIR